MAMAKPSRKPLFVVWVLDFPSPDRLLLPSHFEKARPCHIKTAAEKLPRMVAKTRHCKD